MTRKLFLVIFTLSLIFMAFHTEDCYSQRSRGSGRSFNRSNTGRSNFNSSGRKSISGNNSTTKRNFNDVNKRNSDINKNKVNTNDVKRNNNNNNNNINRNNNNINTGNINVNRNTNVYHGYSYSGYHPYSYHGYSPYHYGSYWHPYGFFLAAMFTTAVIVSVSNQSYYYNEGVYYEPSGSGYVVVKAPVGATITELPAGYASVAVASQPYYYYGGVFYTISGSNYVVVAAPVGAVVSDLPEGAVEVEIEGVKLLKYNDAFFQPVSQNGDDAYEVVQIKK